MRRSWRDYEKAIVDYLRADGFLLDENTDSGDKTIAVFDLNITELAKALALDLEAIQPITPGISRESR